MTAEQDKRFRRRFFVFMLFLTALAAYIFIRYLRVVLYPSAVEQFSITAKDGERGAIVDRNGILLAVPTRLGDISVWKPNIDDLDAFARALSPILGMGESDIRNKIIDSRSDSVSLKKRVEYPVLQEIQLYRSQYRRNDPLTGIKIDPVAGRKYPEHELAAQIIGFTNEGPGAGIEHAFNGELVPQGEKNGSQVRLTIDSNIQYMLEGIAGKALEANDAESVIIMAVDPRTGDILGAASVPGFDPNRMQEAEESQRTDRISLWAYEPGSVFKVFTIASLLEAGAVNENTYFTCNGRYERTSGRGEQYSIRCVSVHGRVNPRDIIVYSCNTGAAYASERMRQDGFRDALGYFGFGAKTGAGTPGETSGVFRQTSDPKWSERSKPTIAMGQEISVSPLQIVQAASVIANDGVLVPPRFVSHIDSADGTTREYHSGQARRVISPETAREMRRYMAEGTIGAGLGRNARIGDISLAVKTGTSQTLDPETGSYSEDNYIASCLALLPAEQPSLILYAAIMRPRGPSIYGANIAAPVIRESAEALIDYLGIPRARNPRVYHSDQLAVPMEKELSVDNRVPDFTGVPKRSLLPFLLRDDLILDIRGEGWVRRQIPAPGTLITRGMTIVLELE